MSLETYAKERAHFRARVLEHKRARTVHLGEHLTLVFEDELTLRYQIQEMLRIEKTFEEAGIQDELDAYNPLVPDGSNFKATMLIEYEDVEERRRALARAARHRGPRMGPGRRVTSRVYAIADEDLDRENDEKTSAVHFLRFELDAGDGRRAEGRRAAGHRRRPSALRRRDSRRRRSYAQGAGGRPRLGSGFNRGACDSGRGL